MPNAIWWIRRDMRLVDNPVIDHAVKSGFTLIPIFIMQPGLFDLNLARVQQICEGLKGLRNEIHNLGEELILCRGNPKEVLRQVLTENQAIIILTAEDFTPFSKTRDEEVSGIFPLELVKSYAAIHPKNVLKQDGTPYKTYSSFRKRWLELYNQSPPDELTQPRFADTSGIKTDPIPDCGANSYPDPIHQMNHFFTYDLRKYGIQRDFLFPEGTSKLSGAFRTGRLSVHQAIQSAREKTSGMENVESQESGEKWIDEIIWREFYYSVAYHFPEVFEGSFRKPRKEFWLSPRAEFSAWKAGETGYPVVDAAMRQLAATGWMHNRARMITASFLTKHLLIDWQSGENWFLDKLRDGDPAVNNGNWQWVAGTGVDAQPYFRIFNPITQGKKFDPTGMFIRTWVPELSLLPDKYIYSPWEMPEEIQQQSQTRIGVDYPPPLIDHSYARQRALDLYKQGYS
ncbi:MAG: deoxyribodipyrimidine photo-lyase [Anaerolineales bacterium]|nr:deoxyribodipyrimidine photo-lyase [Anaerolineales bacterium]